MSAPQSLDDLYKEIIAACDGLKEDARRRADFWTGLDAWVTAIDNHSARLRAGGGGFGGGATMRMGMPDPQRDERPEVARNLLLALHFGAPEGAAQGSPRERLKAAVAHVAAKVEGSGVLAKDARARQRVDLAKAKLLVPTNPPPPDAHLAAIGMIVACYRALRDAAKKE